MATETIYRTTARITAYLDDITFPASRAEILRCAEDNEAPDAILDAIEKLPELRYWSIREVLAKIEASA
ncbi:MAG: DUF2795 domain-containing protein [Armatimonadetes bacterium]|nr:DUF2795 domain-containing protein [Armatimonadota bacterium]